MILEYEDGDSLQRPEDYHIVEMIQQRRAAMLNLVLTDANERGEINRQSAELSPWLHAFCELVPIHEMEDLSDPDKDWLPVLMRHPNPETSRMILAWHNRVFPPPGSQTEVEPSHYAMDAAPAQYRKGIVLDGWNDLDPGIIPSRIKALVWGEQIRDLEASANAEETKESSRGAAPTTDIFGQ